MLKTPPKPHSEMKVKKKTSRASRTRVAAKKATRKAETGNG
jgi:hypothetical protein